jgi:uncharacterized membrane protein
VPEVQVQRVLERGLNPLLSLLPLSMFAVALLADLGALMSGLASFGDIADAVLAVALIVGLLALTALLVEYTTAPVGSVAQHVRGSAGALATCMVGGFALAWSMRGVGAAGGLVFVVEMLSFAGGLLGHLLMRTPAFEPVERVGDVSWLSVTAEFPQIARSRS